MSGEPARHKLPVEESFLVDVINRTYGTNATAKSVEAAEIGDMKGFMSVVTKAKIDWEGDDNELKKLPDFVVMKKPTDEKIKRIPHLAEMISVDMIRTVHNTEVKAYKYLTAHPPAPIPMARLLHAEPMEALGSGILILEGVTGGSLGFNDRITLGKAREILKHVTAVQNYAADHTEYRSMFTEMPVDISKTIVPKVLPGAAKSREVFGEKFRATDDQINAILKRIPELVDLSCHPIKAGYSTTFALGDLQPNNVLWKFNADGTLSDEVVAMLDFQVAHIGSHFDDLAQILINSMHYKDLRENRRKFLSDLHAGIKAKYPDLELSELEEIADKITAFYAVIGIPFLTEIGQMGLGITDETVNLSLERNNFFMEHLSSKGWF